MHFSCADFFKEFIKMIYMDLRWSGINSMTLLDNAKYMVEEHVKSKNMETYMCDTCFIAKILQRIQKYEIYRPHFSLSHLHDPRVHQGVHGGLVDQVPTYENIYVWYMFHT